MENLNANGQPCEDKDRVAYKTDKHRFALEYCGNLYTKDTVMSERNSARTKFVKLGPKSYDNYVKYLTTGLMTYYRLASRNRVE